MQIKLSNRDDNKPKIQNKKKRRKKIMKQKSEPART